MKETLKKILCLVLALACVFAFVSCGKKDAEEPEDEKEIVEVEDKEDKKEEKEPSDEEKATEAAENFMDAFIELDFDEAAEYLDDPDAIEEAGLGEIAEIFDADVLLEAMVEESPELEPYTEKFRTVFETIIDKAVDSFDYEIKDIEKDGDDFIVTVDLTTVSEDMDFDTAFAEVMSDEDMENIAEELYNDGKINEDMTEEELMDVVLDEVIGEVEKAVEEMEFETTTEEIEFKVVEKGGEWLVSVE